MDIFYNYTNEDFHITWGSKPYTFAAGSVSSGLQISNNGIDNIVLTRPICEVFAHHLAHKVLNTPSLDMNFRVDKEGNEKATDVEQRRVHNFGNQKKLIERALAAPNEGVEIPKSIKELPLMGGEAAESLPVPEPIEESPVREPIAEQPKKRAPGRPKKEIASPSPEAEFAT